MASVPWDQSAGSVMSTAIDDMNDVLGCLGEIEDRDRPDPLEIVELRQQHFVRTLAAAKRLQAWDGDWDKLLNQVIGVLEEATSSDR